MQKVDCEKPDGSWTSGPLCALLHPQPIVSGRFNPSWGQAVCQAIFFVNPELTFVYEMLSKNKERDYEKGWKRARDRSFFQSFCPHHLDGKRTIFQSDVRHCFCCVISLSCSLARSHLPFKTLQAFAMVRKDEHSKITVSLSPLSDVCKHTCNTIWTGRAWKGLYATLDHWSPLRSRYRIGKRLLKKILVRGYSGRYFPRDSRIGGFRCSHCSPQTTICTSGQYKFNSLSCADEFFLRTSDLKWSAFWCMCRTKGIEGHTWAHIRTNADWMHVYIQRWINTYARTYCIHAYKSRNACIQYSIDTCTWNYWSCMSFSLLLWQ